MSERFPLIFRSQIDWDTGVPYSEHFQGIYFSNTNGLEESRHVFIQGNRLLDRWQTLKPDGNNLFVIGETGFGSGLNFLLTYHLWQEHAPKTAKLRYLSCELHPWDREDFQRALSLWPSLNACGQRFLKQYPPLTPGTHILNFEQGRVQLILMIGEAQTTYQGLLSSGDPTLEKQCRPAYVDAWYLDGFTPSKNESMWTNSLFYTLALLSRPQQTTFATFTAARSVKAALTDVGFCLKKTKGYGKKKHMIVGRLENQVSPQASIKKNTPWHCEPTPSYQTKNALIIGAGLAGCYCAHALHKHGWETTIVDEKNGVAQGGSGNERALLFPKFSAYRAPFTEWMLTAYLYALNAYKSFLTQPQLGSETSLLQYAEDTSFLYAFLNHYSELAKPLNKEEASDLSGLKINANTIQVLKSAIINMPELCTNLLQGSKSEILRNTHVTNLVQKKGLWEIPEIGLFDVVIIANGHRANTFEQTHYLKLRPIRGQMSQLAMTRESQRLKIPICGSGHILPHHGGQHTFGATYHTDNDDSDCWKKDDEVNQWHLERLSKNNIWSREITGHWAGIRAATPDYLPYVGPVTHAEVFKDTFSKFSKSAQYWIPKTNPVFNGLYVCAGFGSRGLTSIPLAADYLASLISGDFQSLPNHLAQAISPARFLRKSIIRSESHP